MTEGFIETPGGRLHYEDVGEGPAVTLNHPGLWDMRTWDREVERWPAEGLRVIRYDARGYGRSDYPETPFSNEADLLALLDALEVDRTALVGCSMGGNIAVTFALAYPERVWALVTVAAGLSGFDWSDEKWAPIWEPVDEALAAGDLERATDLCLEIWAPLGTDDAAGALIRRIALDNTQNFALDESGLELEADPPPITRLEQIDVPTLVVTGDADVTEMTTIGEILASRIPGAVPHVIEGADHVVNVRQPEAFEAAVLPFLLDARP
jgi:pimeloyl-ACP methyl ester carboxylesterase